MCARFPYQTFSISGKQKGFEDSIGSLFFDISKIVREKNPKVIFIKNGKNFAMHYGEKPYTLSKRYKRVRLLFQLQYSNPVHYKIPQKKNVFTLFILETMF